MHSAHRVGRLGLGVMDTVLPTKQCQLEILSPLLGRKKKVYRQDAQFLPNSNKISNIS